MNRKAQSHRHARPPVSPLLRALTYSRTSHEPVTRSMLLHCYTALDAFRRGHGSRELFATLGRYLDEGRDVHGDLPPLVAGAVLAGKDQEAFLPGLSPGLQQKLLFPMAKEFEQWRSGRRRARAEAKELRGGDAWDDW